MDRQGAKTCPVNRGSGLLSQARLGGGTMFLKPRRWSQEPERL